MQESNLSGYRDILRVLFKSCSECPEKERYHALYIRSLGYTRKSVAELFCRDEGTMQEWEERRLRERNVNMKRTIARL